MSYGLKKYITINGRKIGPGHPTYITAEMSANHNQDFDKAIKIIEEAKEAGADAVKLQTATPDGLTINSKKKYFKIGKNVLWEGKYLYELYREAHTPWEWQPRLKKVAEKIGLDLFSSPFEKAAVDFLEEMNVPAYKIASAELVDLELIRYISKTGKPIIMSTGMANLGKIEEAILTAIKAGATQIALLKCNSTYPAPPEEMNLRTIPHLAQTFSCPTGLSDHTLGISVSIAAVALGSTIIEKHFTLSRDIPSPDSAFSIEPKEFKEMVSSIRIVEKAIGNISYEAMSKGKSNRVFHRSLFVVQNMKAGEIFTEKNVRSIRPGYGLLPKYLSDVLGRKAPRDIKKGTPFDWSLISSK